MTYIDDTDLQRGMKIFLDTADTEVIGKHYYSGLIDGVTTNQKIFLKEKGVGFKDRILEICKVMGSKPVSVESNGITLSIYLIACHICILSCKLFIGLSLKI